MTKAGICEACLSTRESDQVGRFGNVDRAPVLGASPAPSTSVHTCSPKTSRVPAGGAPSTAPEAGALPNHIEGQMGIYGFWLQ